MIWAPGDLALCVAGWKAPHLPHKGWMGYVADVSQCGGVTILCFARFGPNKSFDGDAFRKIEPHEFDEDDLAVIDLYKRTPEPADLQQVGGSPCSASEPQPVTSRGAPITENGASP